MWLGFVLLAHCGYLMIALFQLINAKSHHVSKTVYAVTELAPVLTGHSDLT